MRQRLMIGGALICAAPAFGQAMPQPTTIVATLPTAATGNVVELPANTELLLSMNNDLTTKGAKIEEGEKFNLSVVYDVKIGDYVVIPRGARGVGEVTWKTGKGAFGKSGKMDVELRYVEFGSNRVNVTGKYRQEGEGNEPRRVCRRLQLLRRWSPYEQDNEQVCARGAGTRGADGAGPRTGSRFAMGGRGVDIGQDRLCGADAV